MTERNTAPAAKGARAEGIAQIVIMLAIGIAAGAASFTHVHAVASTHGQNGWLAWADAVVLELMSVASGLELRRRKRVHAAVRFPALVLVFATALSISAQVVEAQRSFIGWIAAALPTLGFLVMVKIALARSSTPASVGAEAEAIVRTRDRGDVNVNIVAAPVDEIATAPERHSRSAVEPTASERTRTRQARTYGRREPGRGVRADAAHPDPKVPVTATALVQWADTWVRMCTDDTTVHGSLNDDEYARDRYQLSSKQLRNVRKAATAGALRRRARELGVSLPNGYVDRPAVDDGALVGA